MLWSGELSAATPALLADLAGLGYGSVELPLFGPARLDLATLGSQVAAAGLACTANTALPPGLSLLDPDRQAAAVEFLRAMAGQARALGATLLCGPLLAPVGDLPPLPPGERERAAAAGGLALAAGAVAEEGVTLALEPLNRFESAFPNTVEDALSLVAEGPANLGLLLDTFHMNIEERALGAAIRHAGRRLLHVHCSENDRGPVGRGHIPWEEVGAALDAIGYAGGLVVESFGSSIPAIARACCIWRPLAESPRALAVESAAFLRRLVVPGSPAKEGFA